MRHVPLLLPLLFVAALAGSSRGGTLVTREGRTVAGELTLSADGVAVKPPQGAPASFKFAEIARADFGAAVPAGAAEEAVAPARTDNIAETGGRIFVEYFADPEMKERKLARYEKTFMHAWSMAEPPDP